LKNGTNGPTERKILKTARVLLGRNPERLRIREGAYLRENGP